MTGWDYFTRAVTTKYADFSGRARRSEFWFFKLFSVAFIIGLPLVILSAFGGVGVAVVLTITVIAYLLLFLPNLAVTVRRFHDTGHSGWLVLLTLIPSVGLIVTIVFGCIDSKPRPNKWGPNPKGVDNMDYEYDVSKHLIDDDLV